MAKKNGEAKKDYPRKNYYYIIFIFYNLLNKKSLN
jgi:hypothetical protein